MIKLIHIDNFFESTAHTQQLNNIVNSLQFIPKEFGDEIDQFNMVNPELTPVFSNLLNIDAHIDEDRSGIFRKPDRFIHFEGFDRPDEWVFAVALAQTTFNVFRHNDGYDRAIDKHDLQYRNLFDWDYTSNILLEENQCVFFRPWLFHSFSGGIIHMYRISDKKYETIGDNNGI